MSPIVAIHKVSAAAGNLKRRFESAMNAIEQTENPAATTRVTKLRESCDSCLVAKVKCSKTRPVCTRCLANGAACGYSPSSRAGRKNRNAAVSESSKPSSRFEKASAADEGPSPTSSSFLHPLHPMLDSRDGPVDHSTNGVFHNSTSHIPHEDPSQGQSGMDNTVTTPQSGM